MPHRKFLAVNGLASALIGDFSSSSARERNIARDIHRGVIAPVRTDAEQADTYAESVANMREALGRYPADDYLSALGDDLRAVSPSFAELWEQQPVA
jgi:hypothetical protein